MVVQKSSVGGMPGGGKQVPGLVGEGALVSMSGWSDLEGFWSNDRER